MLCSYENCNSAQAGALKLREGAAANLIAEKGAEIIPEES